MAARELVVLGTASQAPTRERNHGGYFLRWDEEGILFDPGEGTQRQLLLAGVPSSAITRICITHFHGDHCLGLPGVVQRMSLDRVGHSVDIYFPESGLPYLERLLECSIHRRSVELVVHPITAGGVAGSGAGFTLFAEPLDHRDDALGWRLEEPGGRRMLPERLQALGISGKDIGVLQRQGVLEIGGKPVTLEEVSEHRPGQKAAFVMDTKVCEGAYKLAKEADLLLCESTFLGRDARLAEAYAHLTAAQAAEIAEAARARLLVLSHFSQRYPDEAVFEEEARHTFPAVIAARDLVTVPVPPRSIRPQHQG